MGISMPKFITDRYYSFRETCRYVKEGWQATKLIFSLARKLESSKVSETQNPDDLLETLRNTENMPDTFKNILSSLDSNALKSMLKITMDAFSKNSSNPTEPSNVRETISKMADKLAESKREKEVRDNNATFDRIAEAAEEQAKFQYENMHKNDNTSQNNNEESEGKSSHGNDNNFDRSGLDRMIDVALDESNDTMKKMGYKIPESKQPKQSATNEEHPPPGNNYKNQEASRSQTNSSSAQSEKKDEPEFIPSQMYKDILGTNKNTHSSSSKKPNNSTQASQGTTSFHTARDFQEFTRRESQKQQKSDDPNEKNLPPLTKMLGEELKKRYGANWREQVPTFMKNPNLGPIPDLGLGLSKEGNKNMVTHMSQVLKDLF